MALLSASKTCKYEEVIELQEKNFINICLSFSNLLVQTQKRKKITVHAGEQIGFQLQLHHLETLQHGKLRRQPLQVVRGQIDMGNQQQLVQVA